MSLSPTELAGRVEVLLWRADLTAGQVRQICEQAQQQQLYGVGVPGSHVELAASLLAETGLKVTALVGFPLGNAEEDAKRYEAEVAVDCGAQEIEMVLNSGRLKDGDRRYVLRELRDLAEAVEERPVKVIIETALLTRDEMQVACELILDSGVQGVTAASGMNGAASADDVALLRELVGPRFGVKAFADRRDPAGLFSLMAAGATRLNVGAF